MMFKTILPSSIFHGGYVIHYYGIIDGSGWKEWIPSYHSGITMITTATATMREEGTLSAYIMHRSMCTSFYSRDINTTIIKCCFSIYCNITRWINLKWIRTIII
jgi:hypothetical protein